jgi:DNA-binding CsgD family transcriptional regulator
MAERIVEAELKRRRWNESSLSGRRQSDAEKVKIALRLRRESIMTLKWIAQRLQMGTSTHLNHLLYWHWRETRR